MTPHDTPVYGPSPLRAAYRRWWTARTTEAAREAAHAALSAACVAFGRRLAGLPALPAKETARA
jgi:hypothetical protein